MKKLATTWGVLFVAGLGLLTGCKQAGDTVVINVTGPFKECTVIILPTARVSLGDQGVTVRDNSSIVFNGVVYTVDLSTCNARTETTTTTGVPL